jgi:diketogulonate reductase-like aldo/keto reductase
MANYILNNGVLIPSIGFGTWQNPSGDVAIQSVHTALELGYRHIDTAAIYGNEQSIGEAIATSSIPRKEIFITSKVWNTSRGYENAIKAFEKTLSDLKLEYLDLYLIHWPANASQFPGTWQQLNNETWHALEDLYKQGKIKSIGVSNFLPHHLEPLLAAAEIIPAVNQIEFHPGLLQKETLDYCQANNILIEAWAPLGRGKIFSSETLLAIAEKHGKSIAQVCIKWCLQHGALPLPKSVTAERIKENFDVFDFTLDDGDLQAIDDLPYIGGSGLHPDSIGF